MKIDGAFLASLENLHLTVVIFEEFRFEVSEAQWDDFYRKHTLIREYKLIWYEIENTDETALFRLYRAIATGQLAAVEKLTCYFIADVLDDRLLFCLGPLLGEILALRLFMQIFKYLLAFDMKAHLEYALSLR